MHGKKCSVMWNTSLAILAVALLVTSSSASTPETVLHSFNNNGTDGASPQASLVADTAGNLYGTTYSGGPHNVGTVFELTPTLSGWTETVLHSFNSNGTDGTYPAAGLIFDAAGDLYGTTFEGGTYLYGTVFELTPAQGGGWAERVLYNFGNGTDAAYPSAGLIFDAAGSLYGTTTFGGPSGAGTIFELTPTGGGGWSEHVLYNLGSLAAGIFPYAGVIFDKNGNLYGTTSTGGTSSGGTVFKLAPSGGGWTKTVLHNFGSGTDGATPYSGLIFDAAGNLYGTTSTGGAYTSYGTVFELMPGQGGSWTEQVVHSFGSGSDGTTPYAGLISDVAGNLYGTTLSGGAYDEGTVFRFNAQGELVLHSFGSGADGSGPVASLVFDAAGNLYGTTNYGGTHFEGTAFEVTPPTALKFIAVTPCRVVDTRQTNGLFGGPPIAGGSFRSFPLPQGACDIPGSAAAYSLNVTAIPIGTLGYLTIWPTGQGQPLVSTMNSLDGRIKANAAIVPGGTLGAVSVYVSNTSNVALDIDGYFAATGSSALEFYPLTPCRVLDTRNPTGTLGGPYLASNTERDFPVLSSSCDIPSGAQSYSMNFTVVPYQGQPLGYLTVWAQGATRPGVSTLNNLTATIVANAAIVPAGTGGGIAAYPSGNTQLVGDIDGYFAPAGTGGLSLYAVTPCRALDTRNANGAFSGELTVNVAGSTCAPPSTAQGYVFNATVIPVGSLGYLTLWPDGENQPVVSTLNAVDGAITSNMAIVPTNNGKIDALASGRTQLVLDISSYFAP